MCTHTCCTDLHKYKFLLGDLDKLTYVHAYVHTYTVCTYIQFLQNAYCYCVLHTLQAEIAELEKQRTSFLGKMESLKVDVASGERAKHVSQDLAGHLEKELQKTRTSYQKLQGENCELRVKLEDSHTREQQLDMLLTSQRKQRSNLDSSLKASNQQNLEAQMRIRELEGSLNERERDFKKKFVNCVPSYVHSYPRTSVHAYMYTYRHTYICMQYM